MKLIDGIIPEPEGGAQANPEATIAALGHRLESALDELSQLSPEQLIEQRYNKFRQMGNFFTEVLI